MYILLSNIYKWPNESISVQVLTNRTYCSLFQPMNNTVIAEFMIAWKKKRSLGIVLFKRNVHSFLWFAYNKCSTLLSHPNSLDPCTNRPIELVYKNVFVIIARNRHDSECFTSILNKNKELACLLTISVGGKTNNIGCTFREQEHLNTSLIVRIWSTICN